MLFFPLRGCFSGPDDVVGRSSFAKPEKRCLHFVAFSFSFLWIARLFLYVGGG